MAATLAPIPPVDHRIEAMRDALKENEEARHYFPDLDKLLTAYLDHSSYNPIEDEVDKEKFNRGLLQCFWKTQKDDTYSKVLQTYTPDEQKSIRDFVEKGHSAEKIGQDFVPQPSPPVREEIGSLLAAPQPKIDQESVENGPVLHEDPERVTDQGHGIWTWFKKHFKGQGAHEDVMVPHTDMEFLNWGRTVKNKPRFTYVPRTTKGVQAIVNFAIQVNMSVRVSGFRHSWSPIFGREGQILISTIHIHEATVLPNTTSLPKPWGSKPTELESITLLPDKRPDGKKLVKVGCACTNEKFRIWCKSKGKVTLPLNVIMVEITLGGSNAPICHGSGIKHKTLSDLVKQIEYVDAHGQVRVIKESDGNFLKAASGCFGVMGVILHLTLEVEPISYAEMWPSKIPTLLAVPPPPGKQTPIPEAFIKTRDEYLKATGNEKPIEQVMKDAQAAFEDHANNDYYAEWFWFPYADYVWINAWKSTTDSSNVEDYPSNGKIFLQWTETVLMNIFQNIPFINKVVDWFGIDQPMTTLISKAAMLQLPERVKGKKGIAGKPIKTTIPDALHFQRAIQNVRVRDMEVEVPLVPSVSNPKKVDYTIIQTAWWDAIALAYQNGKTCPQRMPLEMRIMGDSDVIMAPQRGNTLGTCSIEVLTLESCKDIWLPYAQQVLDKWMSYTHDGKPLRVRPHWAKEWAVRTPQTLKVNGKDWFEHVKMDAANEINEFKGILAEIGKRDQWTLEDLKKRFSNDLLDRLFFDDVK